MMRGPSRPPAKGETRGTTKEKAGTARSSSTPMLPKKGTSVWHKVSEYRRLAGKDPILADQEIAKIEGENESLKRRIAQLTETGEHYRRKVEDMFTQSRTRLADMQEKMSHLEVAKQDVENEATETAAQLALANSSRRNLEVQLSQLQQTLQQATQHLGDTKSQLSIQKAETARLETENGHLKGELREATGLIHQLQVDLHNMTIARDTLQVDFDAVDKERRAHEEEIASLKEGLVQAESGRNAAMAEVWQLNSRLEALTVDCLRLADITGQLLGGKAASSVGDESPHLVPASISTVLIPQSPLASTLKKPSSGGEPPHDESPARETDRARSVQRELLWKSNLHAILYD